MFLNLIKNLGTSLGFLILYIFVTAISYLIFNDYVISSLASSIGTSLIIGFIYRDYLKKKIKTIKKDFRIKSFINALIAIAMVFVLDYMLIKIFGSTSENEKLVEELIKSSPIIYGINAVIITPLTEEFIFRLPYRNKYKIISLLISSLIFSAVHIGSLNEIIFIIPYMILALGIGINYFKTDNIYISYFVHVLNNLINMILLMWWWYERQEEKKE